MKWVVCCCGAFSHTYLVAFARDESADAATALAFGGDTFHEGRHGRRIVMCVHREVRVCLSQHFGQMFDMLVTPCRHVARDALVIEQVVLTLDDHDVGSRAQAHKVVLEPLLFGIAREPSGLCSDRFFMVEHDHDRLAGAREFIGKASTWMIDRRALDHEIVFRARRDHPDRLLLSRMELDARRECNRPHRERFAVEQMRFEQALPTRVARHVHHQILSRIDRREELEPRVVVVVRVGHEEVEVRDLGLAHDPVAEIAQP